MKIEAVSETLCQIHCLVNKSISNGCFWSIHYNLPINCSKKNVSLFQIFYCNNNIEELNIYDSFYS